MRCRRIEAFWSDHVENDVWFCTNRCKWPSTFENDWCCRWRWPLQCDSTRRSLISVKKIDFSSISFARKYRCYSLIPFEVRGSSVHYRIQFSGIAYRCHSNGMTHTAVRIQRFDFWSEMSKLCSKYDHAFPIHVKSNSQTERTSTFPDAHRPIVYTANELVRI